MMVELLLGLVLVASLLVLSALVWSSRTDRTHEAVITRTLGAQRGFLYRIQVFEFALLALMSSSVALLCAELAVFALKQRVFEGTFTLRPELWLVTIVASMVVIAGFGFWQTRHIPNQSPMRSLRGN